MTLDWIHDVLLSMALRGRFPKEEDSSASHEKERYLGETFDEKEVAGVQGKDNQLPKVECTLNFKRWSALHSCGSWRHTCYSLFRP